MRALKNPTLQAVLWAALVAVVLFLPGDSIPVSAQRLHLDKIVHLALFFVLVVLLRRSREARLGPARASVWALSLTIPYAVVLEIGQAWIPGRYSEGGDLLAGLAGTVLAFLLRPLAVKG